MGKDIYKGLNERMVQEAPKTGLEYALNAFYAKDGLAWVRGIGENGEDLALHDVVRGGYDHRLEYLTDDEIGETMLDDLQYGVKDPAGIMALFYQAAWVAAELRARLEEWENGTRQKKGWISVKDRLPKPDTRVQISYETKYQFSGVKRNVQTYAVYQDGTVNQMNSNWIGNADDWLGDAGAEYDEEINDYLIPKGWYEVLTGTNAEYFCELNNGEKVTHWMPAPKPPEVTEE